MSTVPLRVPQSRLAVLATATLALTILSAPARAGDYCPDRPGLDTPPCTVDPGHLSIESSLIDWSHDATTVSIDDTVIAGDLELRYGIDSRTEARFGWTPYGHSRSRDRATGQVTTLSGTGDVTLGIKRRLSAPDDSGISLAVLPYLALPTGGDAIGAGTWSAGLQVPANLPLDDRFSLMLTPSIAAAANSSGHGRHLAYGVAAGLGVAPVPQLNLAFEGSVLRDDDPLSPATQWLASASAGLLVSADVQVDLGLVFDVGHSPLGRRVYLGLSRRF